MAQRHTLQKDIVYSALTVLHNHPTADMVYNYIHKHYPSISRATVYRGLNQMAENGQVLKIALFDGADCFDHIVAPHCHARCNRCHQVFDVNCSRPPLSVFLNGEENGFEVSDYSLQFNGICRCCREEIGEE